MNMIREQRMTTPAPSRPRETLAALAALCTVALGAPAARADRGLSTTARPLPGDRGGAILGMKVGGLLAQPFSALGASYYAELEAGYLLPYLRRLFSVTASVAIAAPPASGSGGDPRLGDYEYSVAQQQLTFGLTVAARAPLGRFVPYLGVGPRLTLVRTSSSGQTLAGEPLGTTRETSTEIGVGVPLGVDVLLGPGRLFVEGQILWSAIDQRSTGPASIGALTFSAGYRFVL